MKPLARLISIALVSATFSISPTLASADSVTPTAVIENYVNLAHASFSDSLKTAQHLQRKINEFISKPSAETHQAAKQAWIAARIPYGQTEVFRFGNSNVDEIEGSLNAWPLDEGLIDYVKADRYDFDEANQFAQANIIAGKEPITKELLRSYQEKGGAEANVATGYHAIEFLLWGQDFNEDPKAAGQRPYTDFVVGDGCTNGNCERRAAYLSTATELVIDDLTQLVNDWASDKTDNYRQQFLALDEKEALRRMLFGMGSLSLGELAGERMNVALLAHSQEDEHSCFSDNTHHDIAENARGIQNIFLGRYVASDGSTVSGASLEQLAATKDSNTATKLAKALETTQASANEIVKAAEAGEPFDQQIAAENSAGNERVKATIAALRAQTAEIEAVATVLGVDELNPETSDSLQ